MRKAFVFIVLAVIFVLTVIQDRQSGTSKKLHVQGIFTLAYMGNMNFILA